MTELRLPQNPGIGGLNELTSGEEMFIQNLVGLSYATGDILFYDGVELTNLSIGTAGQVLTVTTGLPSWEDATGGGGGAVSSVNGDTGAVVLTIADLDGTADTMVYYDGTGSPVNIPHGTDGQVLTMSPASLTIGDDPAYPDVTGLGTATLTLVFSGAFDRALDYIDNTNFGPASPDFSSPLVMAVADYSSNNSISSPVKLVHTSTACGGLGYDYPTCVATGTTLGDPAGYYVSGGVWRSASGGGETSTSSVPAWENASSGGISDGDKGDITVSSSGTAWTIDNGVVTYSKLDGTMQGSIDKADSALQSGDNISALTNDAGYTSNTGTVTSVSASVPTGLTISGSPITTSGTLAFGLDTGYVIPLQTTLDGKADLSGATFTGNITANNTIEGFRTQATAAGTTTLVVTDAYTQEFTGTTTQNVNLPTTSVTAGFQMQIINNSTGVVTVRSSGANNIMLLAGGYTGLFTSLVATPTTAAHWEVDISPIPAATTTILVGGGTTNSPVWTTATGSGSPVRSTSPTFATSVIGGATMAVFNTTSTTITAFGAATTMTVGGTPTTAITHNYSTNATATGTTKTVNLGTGGASGSTSNINIGSSNGGTTAIASPIATVGGVNILTTTNTETVTNKRNQPRSSTAASGDITPALATANIWQRTALSAGVTINAPTGTPVLGEVLVFMLLDNGTSRAITWNAAFTTRVMTAALPTATVISKQLLVTCQYNGTTWLCLSSEEL